jgi:hypothetical protein
MLCIASVCPVDVRVDNAFQVTLLFKFLILQEAGKQGSRGTLDCVKTVLHFLSVPLVAGIKTFLGTGASN